MIIPYICFVSVSYLYFYIRYLLPLVAVIEMSTELCHCKTFCEPWSKDSIKFSFMLVYSLLKKISPLILFHNSCKLVKRSGDLWMNLSPHQILSLVSSTVSKHCFLLFLTRDNLQREINYVCQLMHARI